MKEAAERLRRKAAQAVDGAVRTTGRTSVGPGGKVAGRLLRPPVALRRKLRSLLVGRGKKQRLKWQFGDRREYKGLWEINYKVVDGFISLI